MTTPTTEHDLALDYLYGLLDGDDKVRFEAHLVGCARCKAELEANGLVRATAKMVLPSVEPTPRLTGALHAQLMHEAGRRESRGKVLPFVRRMVRHPAYAVAAGLLIVGGAVGSQWYRGKLTMPPAEKAQVTTAAPKVADEAPPAAPTAVAPEPMALDGKNVEKVAVDRSAVELQTKTGYAELEKTVSSPAPASKMKGSAGAPAAHHAMAGKGDDSLSSLEGAIGSLGAARGGAAERKEQAPIVATAKPMAPAKDIETDDRERAPAKKRSDSDDALSGAVVQEERQAVRRDSNAYKSSYAPNDAPQEQPPMGMAQNAGPSTNATNGGYGNAAPTPPPAPAPAATAAAAPKAEAVAQQAYPVEVMRSRANRYAQNDQCKDAVRLYGELERNAPERITSQDRLTYAHCLRMLGDLGPAQNELDQVPGKQPQVVTEQRALDAMRSSKQQPALKRSKAKPAAADTSSAPTYDKR